VRPLLLSISWLQVAVLEQVLTNPVTVGAVLGDY
jgi:hypothetical protein